MRWVIPGDLVTLGVQTVLSSFFFSILGLRRCEPRRRAPCEPRLQRRIRVREHIAPLLPRGASVLDVWDAATACSADHPQPRRPGPHRHGRLVRPTTHIPVQEFDGHTLRWTTAVDVVLLVDVLHHADDPMRLLKEAARVARQAIVIKDHVQPGWSTGRRSASWTGPGNAAHGVACRTTTGPPRSGRSRSSASAPPSRPGKPTSVSTPGRRRRSSIATSISWRGSAPARRSGPRDGSPVPERPADGPALRPRRRCNRDAAWLRHTAGHASDAAGCRTTREQSPRAPNACCSSQVPHHDFIDVYTGGLSYLHAAALKIFGFDLRAPREALFVLLVGWVPVLYYCFSRFERPVDGGRPDAARGHVELSRVSCGAASWYILVLGTFGVAALLRFIDDPRHRGCAGRRGRRSHRSRQGLRRFFHRRRHALPDVSGAGDQGLDTGRPLRVWFGVLADRGWP